LIAIGEHAERGKKKKDGGRYWIRTSDLFRVKEAIYR
jgi:hypothetical protein